MTTKKYKVDREQLLRAGMLVCDNCGFPPNNHFDFPHHDYETDKEYPIGDFGRGGCAHDSKCTGYKERLRNI